MKQLKLGDCVAARNKSLIATSEQTIPPRGSKKSKKNHTRKALHTDSRASRGQKANNANRGIIIASYR